MFRWLEDEAYMSTIATWLFRAYIACGLIVFIICIAYFSYVGIKHIKRVKEFEKLVKENRE